MSTQAAATAVAPTTAKNEQAVKVIETATQYAHIGITAVADLVLYAGARAINKLDSTITVQETVDKIKTTTEVKLMPLTRKLSGYKAEDFISK